LRPLHVRHTAHTTAHSTRAAERVPRCC
jgi:hypothetical protein